MKNHQKKHVSILQTVANWTTPHFCFSPNLSLSWVSSADSHRCFKDIGFLSTLSRTFWHWLDACSERQGDSTLQAAPLTASVRHALSSSALFSTSPELTAWNQPYTVSSPAQTTWLLMLRPFLVWKATEQSETPTLEMNSWPSPQDPDNRPGPEPQGFL